MLFHKLAQRLANSQLRTKSPLLPDAFLEFGYQTIYAAKKENNYDLAKQAVSGLLSDYDIHPEEIYIVIYTSALNTGNFLDNTQHDKQFFSTSQRADLFTYPVSRLQAELDMSNAESFAISQQGCVSLSTAMRLGASLFQTEENCKHILCVASDVMPKESNREVIYNLVSDGAAAILFSRESSHHHCLIQKQVTKPYFWNGHELSDELTATYFPTARNLLLDTVKEAGLTMADIQLILPHNVNINSWKMLCKLINYPIEKVYTSNISRYGHVISSDNFINLKDAIEEKRIHTGDHYILFNFGFGAHWSCSIFQF